MTVFAQCYLHRRVGRQHSLQNCQQEIAVHAPFVYLIHNDVRDTIQAILLHPTK